MKLILAEKPSVAKTIASFLGAKTRADGYFEGNGYIVTYAVGHLVGLYDMKDYDKDRYSGSWKMDNFPFIPADKFKFKVDSSKKKQFDIVKKLNSCFFNKFSGTSPEIIRVASPSTIAVFPTPGFPISTGLFFVRRLNT